MSDVVAALENVQAEVESLRTQVERLQSLVQLGFRLTEAKLYPIEPHHLERLRSIADRLLTGGDLPADECRSAGYDVMAVVRFAEVLDAMRLPGDAKLYVHSVGREGPKGDR